MFDQSKVCFHKFKIAYSDFYYALKELSRFAHLTLD